jgi:hypothetical protein
MQSRQIKFINIKNKMNKIISFLFFALLAINIVFMETTTNTTTTNSNNSSSSTMTTSMNSSVTSMPVKCEDSFDCPNDDCCSFDGICISCDSSEFS